MNPVQCTRVSSCKTKRESTKSASTNNFPCPHKYDPNIVGWLYIALRRIGHFSAIRN